MKGIVFAEFMELVENTFSLDMVDDIIDDSDLENDGAYTSVGLYDHAEMVALVTALSERTGVSVADLMLVFGKHLIGKFSAGHPDMFENATDILSFLEQVDNHVHVEVKKLYPDAELPTLGTKRIAEDTLVMDYHSDRPFADLAYGLMMGAVEHYQADVEVTRESAANDSNNAVFTIKLKS